MADEQNSEPIDMEEIEADVDDDGCVDSLSCGETDEGESIGIETYYARLEGLATVTTKKGQRVLFVEGDNGGTNVQIRIPFSVLEANGFTCPEPTQDDDEDDDES